MDQVTPCKGVSPFSEDTILFTPLPQATSTVDKRPDLLPIPEIVMEAERNSPDLKNGYLSDGLSLINEIQQKLDSLGFNKPQINRVNNAPEVISKDFVAQSLTELSHASVEPPRLSKPGVNLMPSEIRPGKSKSTNNSLPVTGNDLNVSQNFVKMSLSPKTGADIKGSYSELTSCTSKPFLPLHLVPDELKRKTYNLDILSSVEDSERNTAREKAMKIINTQDFVPSKESDSFNNTIPSLQQKSFEPVTPDKDVSGFSQLMNKSDFQKDESWCAANFGLPIKPGDETLSFLSASQVSLNFMPPDDSFLRELGPADPPKHRNSQPTNTDVSTVSDASFRHMEPPETPKASLTYSKNERMRESSQNVQELFSELDSSVCSSILARDLDDYLKDKMLSSIKPCRSTTPPGLKTSMDDGSPDEVLRVSDIAKALQDVPIDATPNSLAKRVMELSDKSSGQKSAQAGYNDVEKCFYEKTVVYGGIVHVDLQSESMSPQTLWTFQDLNPTQIRAIIKSSMFPVKVLLFPLVRKSVIVKVQEVEFDRNERYFARLHVIKLNVESPQVEFVDASELDFGLVPECGTVVLPLTLRCINTNVLVICPKFEQEEFSPFCVEFNDDNDEEIHLAPMQEVTLKIVLKPTKGFCTDVNKVKCVVDFLKICLSPMLGNESICQVPLKASVFHSKLQLQECMLEEPICPNEERQVLLKNSSPCSVNIRLRTNGRFNLSLTSLTLKPNEISAVKVSYIPLLEKDIMEGELILSLVPGDLDFIIKLKGRGNQSNYSFNIGQELSNRSSSIPNSINSTMTTSSTEPEGSLQLECTSIFLVWPSIGLGNLSTIKSCHIRTKGSCKEKLLIEINDPSNSFFLVTNERESKKSEVVVLKPHDRKKISVEFSPKLLGQLKAQLVIRRHKTKNDSDSKQVVLFGFGGCGCLRALNIVMDLPTRQCKLSLPSNFTQKFSLQNWGDGLAFFCLSQKKLEGMHLIVSPLHGLISPGEICTISLTLQADSSGSDHTFFQQLLNKDKSADIILSSLTIIHGDESTRLRLARLFRKYKNEPQLLKSPQVTFALRSLSELFPVNRVKMEAVSSLKDPLTSLYDLFNEGIQELTIDVITPRKTIEDANLEVTQQFVNFPDHSQLDETEYTTFFDTSNYPTHYTFN